MCVFRLHKRRFVELAQILPKSLSLAFFAFTIDCSLFFVCKLVAFADAKFVVFADVRHAAAAKLEWQLFAYKAELEFVHVDAACRRFDVVFATAHTVTAVASDDALAAAATIRFVAGLERRRR
jgi:hypothetical protein